MSKLWQAIDEKEQRQAEAQVEQRHVWKRLEHQLSSALSGALPQPLFFEVQAVSEAPLQQRQWLCWWKAETINYRARRVQEAVSSGYVNGPTLYDGGLPSSCELKMLGRLLKASRTGARAVEAVLAQACLWHRHSRRGWDCVTDEAHGALVRELTSAVDHAVDGRIGSTHWQHPSRYFLPLAFYARQAPPASLDEAVCLVVEDIAKLMCNWRPVRLTIETPRSPQTAN